MNGVSRVKGVWDTGCESGNKTDRVICCDNEGPHPYTPYTP